MNSNTPKKVRRKPMDAVMLASLLPGLGHLYCGEIRRGMVWMAASVGLLIGVIICLFMSSSAVALGFATLFFVASVSLWIANLVFTWRLVRKRNDGNYQLKDYNHWVVYVSILLVSIVGTAFGAAFIVKERAIQAFVVPTGSMMPTIHPGDRLLARKEIFLDRDPERGELVIFRNPNDRRHFFVGRVIALAGDEVEWKDSGEIVVNGLPLVQTGTDDSKEVTEKNGDTEYQISLAPHSNPQQIIPSGKLVVPARHGFILGDNRFHSNDSRSYGPLSYSSLVAKPMVRIRGASIGKLQ